LPLSVERVDDGAMRIALEVDERCSGQVTECRQLVVTNYGADLQVKIDTLRRIYFRACKWAAGGCDKISRWTRGSTLLATSLTLADMPNARVRVGKRIVVDGGETAKGDWLGGLNLPRNRKLGKPAIFPGSAPAVILRC
jgi:hypothetical protein